MYAIGVDLGTVYSAAAAFRDGRVEIVTLGSRTAVMPSVVLVRADDSVLVGEQANRRSLLEPSRVAREFKRRFGDAIPIMLGGTPHSPEALMGRLLRSVVTAVTEQMGGPPAAVCLCHPANWGPYKTDLLRTALRMADLELPVTFAVEPVAAAAYYAHQERVPAGALVAVYDLGGGTFDAAVVRVGGDGSFEIVGRPEGIDHLGGADFDAAVFGHVQSVAGHLLESLDETSATTIAAMAQLRAECTAAKEALSGDTDTSIPVLLPTTITEVRLTRAELEAMIRLPLYDTIAALQRAIRSAGIDAADLHSVLLIGGSSRIPLVAQLVGAELNRPVAVDAHPKHAVALGAALIAGAQMSPAASVETPSMPGTDRPDGTADQTRTGTTGSAAPARAPAAMTPPPGPIPTNPVGEVPEVSPAEAAPQPPPEPAGEPTAPTASGPTAGSAVDAAPRPGPKPSARRFLPAVLAALAVVLAGTGILIARSGMVTASPRSVNAVSATQRSSASASGSASTAVPTTNPLYACPTAASAVRWACLKSATVSNGQVIFAVTTDFTLSAVQDAAHYHVHLFLTNPGGTGKTDPPDSIMQVGALEGTWYNDYSSTLTVLEQAELGGRRQPPDPAKFSLLCARVATGMHGLVPDSKGGHQTGNCIPLKR